MEQTKAKTFRDFKQFYPVNYLLFKLLQHQPKFNLEDYDTDLAKTSLDIKKNQKYSIQSLLFK